MLVLTEKVALRSLPFRCNRGQPDIQSARVHRWDEELVGRFPAFESRYDGRPRFTGIIGMYSWLRVLRPGTQCTSVVQRILDSWLVIHALRPHSPRVHSWSQLSALFPTSIIISAHILMFSAYMDFIFERLKDKNPDGSLQIMYTIHGKYWICALSWVLYWENEFPGGKIFPEEELTHLDGHKGSKPVRCVWSLT